MMGKMKFLMVGLLLLFGALNATPNLKVLVSDTEGRPVPNASVTFVCEICNLDMSIALGCSAKTMKFSMKSTDAQGISIPNTLANTVNCWGEGKQIYANTSYQGVTAETFSTWKEGGTTMTIILPDLHDLKVDVEDQDGNQIEGVQVSGVPSGSLLTPFSGTTGKDGSITFKQIPKESGYLLRFKNGNEEKSTNFAMRSADAEVSQKMSTWDLTVLAQDEAGAPIEGATVTVNPGNLNALTDSQGKAAFSSLIPLDYTVKSEFMGHTAESEETLTKDATTTHKMDIHGPSITEIGVTAKTVKDPISIFAKVSDPSGLKAVRMSYSIDGMNWRQISPVMSSGGYKGIIPAQAADTTLSYKIEGEDNTGNIGAEQGTHEVKENACPVAYILGLCLLASAIGKFSK